VPAANAIALSFKSSSSKAFKDKADIAREAVLQGREMHDSLRDIGLFAPDTIEAVQLGEESGRLAETLDKHFRVMRMRVKFAMSMITQIASSIVWITVAVLLVVMIFRLFDTYVSKLRPEAIDRMLQGPRA
jgi:type II secretory pathway component PulF